MHDLEKDRITEAIWQLEMITPDITKKEKTLLQTAITLLNLIIDNEDGE